MQSATGRRVDQVSRWSFVGPNWVGARRFCEASTGASAKRPDPQASGRPFDTLMAMRPLEARLCSTQQNVYLWQSPRTCELAPNSINGLRYFSTGAAGLTQSGTAAAY